MNIFIDTNVYLSFFHFAKEDLEELKKLIVLQRQKKIVVWLPQQTIEEFERNRDNKIWEALKHLKEQNLDVPLPSLCKEYEEYAQLRKYQSEYKAKKDNLLGKIMLDVASRNLEADKVIKEIFTWGKRIPMDETLVQRVQIRNMIGNPPGKNNSLGDAINWESLLANVPENESLHFVTGDKDYYAPFGEDKGNTFLVNEWEEHKSGRIAFYRQISNFFKSHFPDIKLAAELEKNLLILDLTNSSNFASTYRSVRLLERCAGFSNQQLNEIALAALNNNQIKWILKDKVIKKFYVKLLSENSGKIDEHVVKRIQLELSDEDVDDIDDEI